MAGHRVGVGEGRETRVVHQAHVPGGGLRTTVESGVKQILNPFVDEGIEYLLDAAFNGGSQTSTWYMGLVDDSGFSTFSNADTMSSHSGWTESADYSESNRPEWTAGAAATRAVTNSSTVDFSMNATATIHGIFVTSDNTKSGTSGTLWSTAAFSSNASVTNGDTLKVTYTVSG